MNLNIYYNNNLITHLNLDENQSYTLGRTRENQVVIPLPHISRKLAIIFFVDGFWYLENLKTSERVNLSNETNYRSPEGIEFIWEHVLDDMPTRIVENPINVRIPTTAQRAQQLRNQMEASKKKTSRAAYLVTSMSVLMISSISLFAYKKFWAGLDASELFSETRPKVVEFVIDPQFDQDFEKLKTIAGFTENDFTAQRGFCTGFIVSPSVILTANHCLEAGLSFENRFSIKTSDGQLHKIDQVLDFDHARDYAVLEVSSITDYPYFEFSESWTIGQKVYTVGNVAGEGIAIREGIVSGETVDPNNDEINFLRYSAAASPGNSGGPLVDNTGKVVALVFAKNWSENYNLGTSALVLSSAFVKYGLQKVTHKVNLEIGDLIGAPTKLGLIELAGYSFSALGTVFPDFVDRLESGHQISIELPATLESLASQYNSESQREVKKVLGSVEKFMTEKGYPTDTELWEKRSLPNLPALLTGKLHTNAGTPWLYADQEGHFYPATLNVVYSGTAQDIKVASDNLRSQNNYSYFGPSATLRLVEDRKVFSLKNHLLYSLYEPGSGLTGGNLYYLLKKEDDLPLANTEELLPNQDLVKHLYLSDKGAQVSSLQFFSFLRPKAHKNFTLNEFLWPIAEKKYEDMIGQSWNHYKWNLFNLAEIEMFCNKSVSSVYCSQQVLDKNAFYFRDMRSQAKALSLSDVIYQDRFYSPTEITQIFTTEEANQRLFKDFKLDEKSGTVTFSSAGIIYKLPGGWSNTKAMRFISGVHHNSGQPHWTGFAVETITATPKKSDSFDYCAFGFNFKDLELFDSTHGLPTSQKNDRNLAQVKSHTEVWNKIEKSKIGSEIEIFSLCSPLSKDQMIPNLELTRWYVPSVSQSRKPSYTLGK